MAREPHEISPQTRSHTLQYGDDSIHEGDGGASNGSTDEVDEFVDSFYIEEGNIDIDDDQTSTPGGPNSDEDVYDLYAYTVASTPTSEPCRSAYSSRSSDFNEDDFEYQLGLAIARYDAKAHRWAKYEQEDGPFPEDGLVRGREGEQDITADSLSRSTPHEPCRAQHEVGKLKRANDSGSHGHSHGLDSNILML